MTLRFSPGTDPVEIPYQHHSATSKEAATKIRKRSTSLRLLVLACIRDHTRRHGGCTDQQVQAALGLSGDTQRPRRVSLVHSGLVQDSGRTVNTKSGRKAVVWTA